MFTVFDETTETLIGPFNDYESAQMFVLYASDELMDGGANLSIEEITQPQYWVMDNGLSMSLAVEETVNG